MSIFEFFKRENEKVEVVQENKMSLKERMEWRKNAAIRSVTHIFETLEVLTFMYEAQVKRIDERGHCYIVLVNLNRHFKIGKKIRLSGYNDIEEHIKKYAKTRYGIKIDHVYWKSAGPLDLITLWQDAFLHHSNFADNLFQYKDDVLDQSQLPPWHERTDFGEIQLSEMEAFQRAIHLGSKLPVVHINGKEYDTDIAPLT